MAADALGESIKNKTARASYVSGPLINKSMSTCVQKKKKNVWLHERGCGAAANLYKYTKKKKITIVLNVDAV